MKIPARRRQKKVTLTDIARECNVAPSTVSRALSNPGRVNSQTYERIARKARELGYSSGPLDDPARRFIRGTIALVVPNLTNPFTLELIRGSHAQAQAAGYLFLLASSEESSQLELDWIRELGHTVDGVLLSSPRAESAALRQASSLAPMVMMNRRVSWLSSVVLDTPLAMRQALQYLASLGHRRIAYVRGPADSWIDQERHSALVDEAERSGTDLLSVGAYAPSTAAGVAAADAVLLSQATGVIFFNDILALGALRRFEQLGIDVPAQMSVVGCDDSFGSLATRPGLTTITALGEQLGRTSTELLISQMASPERPHQTVTLPAQLTVRDTTSAAPEALV